MEDSKKRSTENYTQLEETHLEHAAGGGGNITYLVCSKCGREVQYGRYDANIRANICPFCSGKIVLWR